MGRREGYQLFYRGENHRGVVAYEFEKENLKALSGLEFEARSFLAALLLLLGAL